MAQNFLITMIHKVDVSRGDILNVMVLLKDARDKKLSMTAAVGDISDLAPCVKKSLAIHISVDWK